MNDNERESIHNRIADLEKTIEVCAKNIEDGDAKARSFREKKARCQKELTALKRQLKEE